MGTRLGLRAALASAGALIAVAAFAPGAAMAHPCAGSTVNEASSFLSLNSARWVGLYPDASDAEHECEGEGGDGRAHSQNSQSAADPVGAAVEHVRVLAEHDARSATRRASCRTRTGSGAINSDLAFQGKYAYQGTYTGFRIIDIENPADPMQVVNYTGCTVGQGDIVVYRNILVRSWDSPVSAGGAATQACGGTLVGQGFEGIHIFDITDPANPVMVTSTRTRTRQAGPALRARATARLATGCGSHTATAVPHEASGILYIYNGGSNGACTGMDVVKIKSQRPDRRVDRAAGPWRRASATTTRSSSAARRATPSCAGGNGFSTFKFDMTQGSDRRGRRREAHAALFEAGPDGEHRPLGGVLL